MVPDRQKVWTDGRSQNYIPPTLSGDKNHSCMQHTAMTGYINPIKYIFSKNISKIMSVGVHKDMPLKPVKGR